MSSRHSVRRLGRIGLVACGSFFGFDAGKLDELGDAIEVSAEKSAERFGALAPQRRQALIGELLLQVGPGEHLLDRRMQALDDGARRALCLLYTSDAADDLLCVDLG